MSKVIYHSELAKLGPVRVTVTSDVLKSKFSKPGAEKPDYVNLTINNEERWYPMENPSCGLFFNGAKGKTFTLVAEGSRTDAKLTYVGEAAPATPPPATAAPASPAAPFAPPAAPAVPAAAQPETTRPARELHPPAHNTTKPGAGYSGWGARVGMCMTAACNNLTARGEELDPAEVFNIASDLMRVADYLESGKLAPKKADRTVSPENY